MYLYELNVTPCTRCTPSTVISPDSTSTVQLSREVYATSRHRNIFSISSYIQISRKSGSPACGRNWVGRLYRRASENPLSSAKLLPPPLWSQIPLIVLSALEMLLHLFGFFWSTRAMIVSLNRRTWGIRRLRTLDLSSRFTKPLLQISERNNIYVFSRLSTKDSLFLLFFKQFLWMSSMKNTSKWEFWKLKIGGMNLNSNY